MGEYVLVTKTLLVPRPNGGGSIARVIVLELNGEVATVLDIDVYTNDRDLLKEIGTEYSFASNLWDWIAAAILTFSVAASFLWQWWWFILGIIVAIMLWRGIRTSTAQWLETEYAKDPETTKSIFMRHGAVFVTEAKKLVVDRT